MAERQTYKFNQPTQAVPISGSADVWKDVSNTIGTFYNQYVAGEEALLKSEGKRAGIAAASGDDKLKLEMLDAGTVYGAAYNDAAIKAYSAAIEIDVQDSINKYAVDNSENYGAFEEAVKKYTSEFTSGIPDPTFKAIAEQKIKEVQGTYGREIYAKQKEKNHLISLSRQSKQFDISIDVAATKGAEAIKKYFSGYHIDKNAPFDELQALAFTGEDEALAEFTKSFAKEFQQQFVRIDALLNSMQAVPGQHFKEGDLKGKRDEAILEIYSSVFLEEYKQSVSEGKSLEFKEKFREDAIAYIKSKPHLNAMFSDEILTSYAMTTTGTKKNPAMSDIIYERMDNYWKSQQEIQEHIEKKEEEALEVEQTDRFIDSLNDLATKSGDTTISSIIAEQESNSQAYATDDYKFLVSSITSGKFDKDDEESVAELEYYLMTTTDGREQKLQEIKEFAEQRRISWKTVARLGKVVVEDTFGDVTKSADYQNAVAALKPHFQRTQTAYGQEATGADKIWMNKAIIELTERVEGGEKATDVYEEIAKKYVSLFEVNSPAAKEIKKFMVGTGKEFKFQCKAAKAFVDGRFAKHKNPKLYAEDLEMLQRREATFGCAVEQGTE